MPVKLKNSQIELLVDLPTENYKGARTLNALEEFAQKQIHRTPFKIIEASAIQNIYETHQSALIFTYDGLANESILKPMISTMYSVSKKYNVSVDDSIMKDEIFGPILPIIIYNTKEEALTIIEKNKNPLAFYVFTSSSSNEKFWINNVAFGGGCVNNASWHLTNHNLPFGGRGFSGTGNYHGKNSFDTFSHKKAVMKTPTWFDPSIKYPPFKGKLKIFKWIIK